MSVVAIAMLLLLLTVSSWARQAYELHAEIGPEFDSNALRTFSSDVDTNGDPVASKKSGLMRATLGGGIRLGIGQSQLLAATYDAGGKLFLNRNTVDGAQAADEFVQRANASWSMALRNTQLSIAGSYYDIFQRHEDSVPYARRDFRYGTAIARWTVPVQAWNLALWANAGYQGLQYKPSESLGYHAPTGGIGLRWFPRTCPDDSLTDLSLTMTYAIAARYYGGDATTVDENGDRISLGYRHQDIDHSMRLSLAHVSLAELRLWYAFQVNDSNDPGWSYMRHSVGMSFTTPLICDIYMTALGSFWISSFDADETDAAQQQLRLDDDNRTQLGITLTRALSSAWSVGVRYHIYVNEAVTALPTADITATSRHLRHTAGAFIRFEAVKDDSQ